MLPGSRLHRLFSAGQETTAQVTVRLIVLLLITLSILATAFQFDVVLGAFAAGFILRRLIRRGTGPSSTSSTAWRSGCSSPSSS